jgi:hypothetical protein
VPSTGVIPSPQAAHFGAKSLKKKKKLLSKKIFYKISSI